MTSSDHHKERPDWWQENKELRQAMGLPTYEPPRFINGVYTHNVVGNLEEQYNCTIQFIGVNVRHEDNWEIWVNGEPVIEIGRHRDQDGNTIYEMTSDKFHSILKTTLEPNES